MADRFFVPHAIVPGAMDLAGDEAHHMATVRRFSPGDAVTLFNGDGREYAAEVLAVGRNRVSLQVLHILEVDREVAFPIVIAAAMPKGDRGDFLVEKLVELGAARFVPLLTSRTVVVPKESRMANLRRAVIEASKQCGRNVLMAVEEPMPWAKFVLAPWPGTRQILHTGDGGSLVGGARTVAVGPEGGFTPEEVDAALAEGWRAASLGPRVLRVETAALASAIS